MIVAATEALADLELQVSVLSGLSSFLCFRESGQGRGVVLQLRLGKGKVAEGFYFSFMAL